MQRLKPLGFLFICKFYQIAGYFSFIKLYICISILVLYRCVCVCVCLKVYMYVWPEKARYLLTFVLSSIPLPLYLFFSFILFYFKSSTNLEVSSPVLVSCWLLYTWPLHRPNAFPGSRRTGGFGGLSGTHHVCHLRERCKHCHHCLCQPCPVRHDCLDCLGQWDFLLLVVYVPAYRTWLQLLLMWWRHHSRLKKNGNFTWFVWYGCFHK